MTGVIAVFGRACELGMALGWENISMDEGCRELQVDVHWWFAINPHKEPTRSSRGVMVQPQQIYFEWNGFPAGMVSSIGGILVQGELANETTLLEALDLAIAHGQKGTLAN
jgi:hypothetical protein